MISCSNTNQMATLVSSLLLVFPRQSRSYCNAAKTRSSCMGSFVVVCFACLVSSTFLSWSLVNSLQVMVYLIVLSLSFFFVNQPFVFLLIFDFLSYLDSYLFSCPIRNEKDDACQYISPVISLPFVCALYCSVWDSYRWPSPHE